MSAAVLPRLRTATRIDGIDLLRGLAIFLVLMNHVNMQLLFAHVPYTRGLPRQLVYSLVWSGQQGVQIFFAVSGFLITSTSLRRWGSLSRIRLREFYLLRFARIAPLLILLLAILSALHFAGARHFVVSAKTGGLGQALLAACTFHVDLLEARRGYLPGNWDILWSLSVEEMFYLFFPLFCRVLRGGRPLVAGLCLFVLLGPFGRTVLAGHNEVWREYSYLGSMDAIALGCLTALVSFQAGTSRAGTSQAAIRMSRRALRLIGGAGGLLLLFALGFSIRAYRWGLDRDGLYMTLVALGACLLILAAAQTRWQCPRFLAPLRLLGERSYEVYLSHMFVVLALFGLFAGTSRPLRLVPVLFAAVIVCAGLLGELVARFYSEPMNRLLRRHWGARSRKTVSHAATGEAT